MQRFPLTTSFSSLERRFNSHSNMQFNLSISFNSTCLPNELVHLIFQHAAAADAQLCRALCFVSSWAREISLPYLRLVAVRETRPIEELLERPVAGIRSSWNRPSHYTRNLWFNGYSRIFRSRELNQPLEHITPLIVSRYPNAENIAISGECFLYLAEAYERNEVSVAGGGLKITILSGAGEKDEIAFRYGQGLPRLELFDQVTHLIHTTIRTFPDKGDLTAFRRLTHFAFTVDGDSNRIHLLMEHLRTLPQLKMVVVITDVPAEHPEAYQCGHQWFNLQHLIADIRTVDDRFFLLCENDLGSAWRKEVNGGKSIWERAVIETET
ncbi:hypothetical protein C8J56DRAFT_921266 [Mycena floridula]|nr:hypothetical protein C8J56DRAFT_921266 [Mycena floridula]